MSQPLPTNQPSLGLARLRLPAATTGLLIFSPVMIAAGAFITIAMRPFTSTIAKREGDAIAMAWFGLVLLCLGVVFLTVGLAAVSVRSMLQRQTDLLLHSSAPSNDPA